MMFSIAEPDVTQGDHLRFPICALLELGEATQVLAAIAIAAGPEQDYKTFAAKGKLAAIACCSGKTVQRATSRTGLLVKKGYVKRLGREAPGSGRQKRRTVSYQLTNKSLDAFATKFHTLPRAIVCHAQDIGEPLTWAERLLLAMLISRHELVATHLAETGGDFDDRLFFSLRQLRAQTGLVSETIIIARRKLVARKMIEIGEHFSNERGFESTEFRLNPNFVFDQSRFSTSVQILRNNPGPSARPSSHSDPKFPPIGRRDAKATEPDPESCKVAAENGRQIVSTTHIGSCPPPISDNVRPLVGSCPPPDRKVSVALKDPLLDPGLTSLLEGPGCTKRSRQAGATPGPVNSLGKKGGETKSAPLAEWEERARRHVAERQVALGPPKNWTVTQQAAWTVAEKRSDLEGAWKVLDDVEGLERSFRPPLPIPGSKEPLTEQELAKKAADKKAAAEDLSLWGRVSREQKAVPEFHGFWNELTLEQKRKFVKENCTPIKHEAVA